MFRPLVFRLLLTRVLLILLLVFLVTAVPVTADRDTANPVTGVPYYCCSAGPQQVISGYEALRQAGAPMAGLEPVTEGSPADLRAESLATVPPTS
ncbi:hypothetical protein PoB_001886300 [Plakobranchus ocellatus]|uniref:Secreted protein n=1 Tax=Plakobranchus ocellatus TaxID=259542 RepID=A0AAV3ZC94_9GAST|nr:hypothetical protein PoB_001886300 [Plakobranchus ocellatus]